MVAPQMIPGWRAAQKAAKTTAGERAAPASEAEWTAAAAAAAAAAAPRSAVPAPSATSDTTAAPAAAASAAAATAPASGGAGTAANSSLSSCEVQLRIASDGGGARAERSLSSRLAPFMGGRSRGRGAAAQSRGRGRGKRGRHEDLWLENLEEEEGFEDELSAMGASTDAVAGSSSSSMLPPPPAELDKGSVMVQRVASTREALPPRLFSIHDPDEFGVWPARPPSPVHGYEPPKVAAATPSSGAQETDAASDVPRTIPARRGPTSV